jgi:hypothetical protein
MPGVPGNENPSNATVISGANWTSNGVSEPTVIGRCFVGGHYWCHKGGTVEQDCGGDY